jgi:hypothetical protein
VFPRKDQCPSSTPGLFPNVTYHPALPEHAILLILKRADLTRRSCVLGSFFDGNLSTEWRELYQAARRESFPLRIERSVVDPEIRTT